MARSSPGTQRPRLGADVLNVESPADAFDELATMVSAVELPLGRRRG